MTPKDQARAFLDRQHVDLLPSADDLAEFVRAIIEEEREACAQVAETCEIKYWGEERDTIATAIRNQGKL